MYWGLEDGVSAIAKCPRGGQTARAATILDAMLPITLTPSIKGRGLVCCDIIFFQRYDKLWRYWN